MSLNVCCIMYANTLQNYMFKVLIAPGTITIKPSSFNSLQYVTFNASCVQPIDLSYCLAISVVQCQRALFMVLSVNFGSVLATSIVLL